MSSIHDWVLESYNQAIGNDDRERRRLFEYAFFHSDVVEDDPDEAMQLLEQGHALAKELHESWWILYFEHWMIQCLIYKKQNYNRAAEIVVPAVVELRKPGYAALPQRVCLHEDLVRVYLGRDPHGFQADIEAALAYMSGEISPDMQCRFCHLAIQTEFATERRQLAQAEELAHEYLAAAQDDQQHHRADAYIQLSRIAVLREDWAAVQNFARLAEADAREADDTLWVVEALAWQALAAHHLEQPDAQQLALRARNAMRQLSATPTDWIYTALSLYLETIHDLEGALALRDEQIVRFSSGGKIWTLAQAHVERCRLLKALGRLTPTDLQLARDVAAQLKSIEPLQSAFDQLGAA